MTDQVPLAYVISQIGPWHFECERMTRPQPSRRPDRCDIGLDANNLHVTINRSRTGAIIKASIKGCGARPAPPVRIEEAVLSGKDGAFRLHQAIVAAGHLNYPQCTGQGFIVDFDPATISAVLSITRPTYP